MIIDSGAEVSVLRDPTLISQKDSTNRTTLLGAGDEPLHVDASGTITMKFPSKQVRIRALASKDVSCNLISLHDLEKAGLIIDLQHRAVLDRREKKLADLINHGYALSPSKESHGYLIYIPSTKQVVDSSNYVRVKHGSHISQSDQNAFDDLLSSIDSPLNPEEVLHTEIPEDPTPDIPDSTDLGGNSIPTPDSPDLGGTTISTRTRNHSKSLPMPALTDVPDTEHAAISDAADSTDDDSDFDSDIPLSALEPIDSAPEDIESVDTDSDDDESSDTPTKDSEPEDIDSPPTEPATPPSKTIPENTPPHTEILPSISSPIVLRDLYMIESMKVTLSKIPI
ncbi:hypothetical protein DAKH74_049620 [Maudiozyma humilis]|uniref:Peptidase A2 domain-containing protein n=1 Tax=Maudiozyma humilis TaxID=51915 RepID=A0AAV5S3C5_MAUHU|nr:hypothetical protein DAKH74_019400 [Kazachstania humilis]GMM58345.1 hypothetical protein DAKH74_049620 [Kazachstania humilis]